MNKAVAAIIVIVLIALIGFGAYSYFHSSTSVVNAPTEQMATTSTPAMTAQQPGVALSTTTETIGTSVQGRSITAYHYGTGATELLFVGGLHGGYEANTSLVAYQLMDYLSTNPQAIPANERVTVIPVANPDGLFKTTGIEGRPAASDIPTSDAVTIPGRYNANGVDLNRNFDCDWQTEGVWQKTKVSGGSAVFSEPETQAIRAYVQAHPPTAAVVWYSAAGGVYSSSCHNGVLPETAAITKLFASASGYPAHESFDFYATTGDMVNWLAKNSIPAISVLLTNHTDTEWTKNQKGVDALLARYKQ